jgi:hypothetical protein
MMTSARSMTFFSSRANARTEESLMVRAASNGSAETKLSAASGLYVSSVGTVDARAEIEVAG